MKALKIKSVILMIVFAAAQLMLPRHASAEPITVGIAIGLGTGAVVSIAYDQITANYLEVAFAYATPFRDAFLDYNIGRGTAEATDNEVVGGFVHHGHAKATVGYIWDSLDAKLDSKGSYFNFARTYKNGSLKDQETEGKLPPGAAQKVQYDVNNMPLRNKVRIDMHTGKIGSFSSLVGGGAIFIDDHWERWNPLTDSSIPPTAIDYLWGSPSGDVTHRGDTPEYTVPSTIEMFEADRNYKALDWFDNFVAAANNAGTYTAVDGQKFYRNFSFEVDLSEKFDKLDAGGDWYSSVQISESAIVPEPSSLLHVVTGLVGIFGFGRKKLLNKR